MKPTVNYAFVSEMNVEKTKQLLAYLNDNLMRVRKHNYLPDMREVWMLGKKKAEARLQELNAKKQYEL